MTFNSITDLFNYAKRDKYLVSDEAWIKDTVEVGKSSPDGTKKKTESGWKYVPVDERGDSSNAVYVDEKADKPLIIKATAEDIKSIKTVDVKHHSLSKSELKEAYNKLSPGQNKKDGRIVQFTNAAFDKIKGRKNETLHQIIPQLKEIFDNSVPLHDSNYISKAVRPDGSVHKTHENFEGYHNYLGKVKDGNDEYFVRFTVQQLHTKKGKPENNQLHDVFVSDIELYKNETAGGRNLLHRTQATNTPSGFDKILAQALREINSKETQDGAFVFLFLNRL